MRVSASNKGAIWLSVFMFFLAGAAFPIRGENGVSITSAEINLSGDVYLLNADVNFELSNQAIEALNNGVSLFWLYQLNVKEQRNFFWDQTVVEKVFRYRIQYHALIKMYRVTNENSGAVDNFSTLQSALDLLSSLRDYRLIEKSKLDENRKYFAGIKITFERDALPLPLRPVAYLNPDWYLSSDWYLWPLKK